MLKWNVERLCQVHGIERIGFLTLTFKDHVTDAREAQKRWHSLKTGVLNKRYKEWVRVIERQKSGRIHYHVLIVLESDIRTGFDFKALAAEDYRSANAALRSEWAFWRTTAPKYRFGRTEVLPVASSGDGIAKYVGKYIGKHIGARKEEDKGVRLVAYSKGAGVHNCKFDWASAGAENHRRKLQWLAVRLGYTATNYPEKFQAEFGTNWGFILTPWIKRIRFADYPTLSHAASDWPEKDLSMLPWGSTEVHLSDCEEQAKRSQAEALLIAFDERKRVLGQARGYGKGRKASFPAKPVSAASLGHSEPGLGETSKSQRPPHRQRPQSGTSIVKVEILSVQAGGQGKDP